jgi:hypothetical protein
VTAPTVTRLPRATDTFRWRLAIGAVLIAGGYLAWLVIPLVLGSDLTPRVKTALTAFLGSTPLLTKLIAIALLGRPTINFLKNVSPRRSCRLNAGWRPLLGHLQTSEWRRASSA